MCGICGIININSEMTVSQAEIDRMVNQLMHRGPYANAIWLCGNVALGHTILSVIDLFEGR